MLNDDKPSILFLVHRIPFPPNKGDKIRSFNLLKHLATRYRVFLACFVDEQQDMQYIAELNQFCEQLYTEQQNKLWSKVKGLSGFVDNRAITLPYYSSRKMQNWVDSSIQQHNIQRCLVFSSAMAQFIQPHPSLLVNSVIDFVDVDSDKWRQYAAEKSGFKKWFYNREARLLEAYEIQIAEQAKYSSFVSDDEAELFKKMIGSIAANSLNGRLEQSAASTIEKVKGIRNGVDTAFFDPDSAQIKTLDIHAKSVAFTGAMDYWANENAIVWFVKHVWPVVLSSHSDAVLYVVGSKPGKDILALHETNNIIVTGRVEDVRPYILQTSVSIAPLRIARGIQNKVLEALAMAKPLVLTSMAAEGIKTQNSEGYDVIDEPQQMAAALTNILSDVDDSTTRLMANREFVKTHFSWRSEMEKITELVEKQG